MAKKKKLKNFKVMTARGGDAAKSDAASGRSAGRSSPSGGGGGRDPSAATKGKVSDAARQRLEDQKKEARARISPSTTPVGMAIAQGIGVLTGVPYFGGKLGAKMVDYSPMAFGVPKPTRPKQTALPIKGPIQTTPLLPEGDGPIQTALPIEGPIQTKPILPLEKRRLGTVSPTGRFNYSVGLKKGGMLRQGKPKLAKKGWK